MNPHTQTRFALILLLTSLARAISPSPSEMSEVHRWTAAKFNNLQISPAQEPGLIVLENHGPVQANGRGPEPLRIGAKTYEHGLYCHANSRIHVRLPSPGKTFQADIGVDARAGGGSIIFSVRIVDREAFRSDVMRIDHPATPVKTDLAGATEFTLNINDAGDNITSDQGNWADAKVLLNNGSELLLGDLPIQDGQRAAYTLDPPFSFSYAGRPSSEFLNGWKTERSSTAKDPSRKEHSVTYTDPATGLVVRCVAIEWLDSPAIDWTLHLKNTGHTDTPLIENIQALDTLFPASAQADPTLRYNTGDLCTPDSYAPHDEPIPAGSRKRIANTGGRPTQSAFPYFNIAAPGEGVIMALGWPGQWAAEFSRESAAAPPPTGGSTTGAPASESAAGALTGGPHPLHLRAGQELTRFKLHPGEAVRTPRVVLLFYRGDWLRGQNLWRRWMVAHNLPRPGGQLVQPMASLCTGNFYAGLMSNASEELAFLKAHLDAGIAFDAWWQDAGWYPCDGPTWPKTGTWEVDRKRFPKGLKEVSDFVHANNRKSILWFEPERVHRDTFLADQHPEWVHGGKEGGLLKLGDPACRQWITDKIDSLLNSEAIDVYRQDFNIDPLDYWRKADTEDRQGITEIRHVEGYLAYWDELLRRHPTMLIDSCASGGRRNDIETAARSVPLLRSDWYNHPEGQQCHTYGLSLWLPYQGTGVIYSQGKDKYWIRSSMVAEFTFGPDAAGMANANLALLKQMVEEFHRIKECFFGDFWPLTPYSLADDCWMAWQYDRPDTGQGLIQAFRRGKSIYEAARLPLRGLDPKAQYTITDLDTSKQTKATGRDLATDGLRVAIPTRPGSAVLIYQRSATQ